jgi:sporulation protein YabP
MYDSKKYHTLPPSAIKIDKQKGGTTMAYEVERSGMDAGHTVILEGREQLRVSGVEEVASFDENTILLTTTQGELEIQGEGLHIETLSLDGGDLKVEGLVHALLYESEPRTHGGLFSRLFGG